ncbi:unnamed protein product (macronuclear) [Paramecium tetraurelia]|uniref:Uncharacterized protein n=2 Tax=Paramecium TaxID=5884 RepID=A0CE28_PARTE|nr:uncharacterized protein GSPATT00007257001 [Paramecium tetraurelia]CAD8146538.1 unnamed protein product [Paramecium octaurelia]CAK69045.1 unnamed protein product [Paramecium tetraurelia]|eukprot:XP_001436442.1 hypothetical protein (macronuclear) [Paramecium tetraurelia strain d4-2]
MNLCDNSGWDIEEQCYLDTLFTGYLPKLERRISENSSHRIRTLSQPKQINQQASITSLHHHRPTQSQAYQTGSFSANFYTPSTTKSRIRFKFTPTLTQEDQQKQKNISQSPIKKKPKYTIINMSQLLSVTPKVRMHQDSLNKVLERFSNKKR